MSALDGLPPPPTDAEISEFERLALEEIAAKGAGELLLAILDKVAQRAPSEEARREAAAAAVVLVLEKLDATLQ